MHALSELPAWERLFKRIVWQQMGEICGKRILDFGSGEGITADRFAANNEVIAVEPSEAMLANAWKDNKYEQIVGDVSSLSKMPDSSFDMIICHNVLEYIDDKKQVINELSRLLKTGGILSLVKHNRAGRVMQMAVLLDDFDKANALLDRKDGSSSQFGAIRYYDDDDISKWDVRLRLVDAFGIRTFWDLQQNQEKHSDEEWQLKMVQLESRVSKMQEYRDIAFFHHLVFIKE